ncbi:MAG: ribosome small subunit-dependent GTPase A [Bacteroidia bacterium]|nr:ribosome small subunit-dependent GTPase A [Bacteroidia bacterium]MBN4052333.1 ribosome small subunit-dependent GTPase A [Sphingobacteriaceae bacterium AH-315-L07]
MTGTVIKSTGSWYAVRNKSGKDINCRLRGKFRLAGSNATNPIVVGDKVEFELDQSDGTGIINELHKRKNYIIREAASHSKQVQVIAANVDQAYLVVTLTEPFTPVGFIDRFLLTAEAYNVKVNIIFNKSDIYKKKHLEKLDEWALIYRDIGYDCFVISAKTGENIDKVKTSLIGKVSLFAGNSGVGKSTILNWIAPDLELQTNPISSATGKGVHTTTFVEMHEISDNSFLIDTPGIKELGIVEIEPYEISHFFVEMRELIGNCKFNDCLHTNEPNCAILEALENGSIHESRYKSYVNILESLQ